MKVVINRTDAIGDTVLTLPMAKFIKDRFPGSKVIFIVSPVCRELFIDHPYVDDYWVLEKSQNFFKKYSFLKKKFKEFSPEAYFHVGGSHIPSFCAWSLGIKTRGGLKSKWQSFAFLNKAVRQSRSLVAMHESDYNLNLLTPLGVLYKSERRSEFAPEVFIPDSIVEGSLIELRKDLEKENIEFKKDYIIIHPGMTGHTLNWSSRNYARLIERIEKEMPGRFLFLISHTPSDEKFLTGLRDQLSKENYNFLEKKVFFFNGAKRGLRDYMGILKQANLFIGPSTGTTHLANTLGVKVIGLYSPIKVQSALRWGPFKRNNRTEVIVPDVVCGEQFECAGRICPYYECMVKIEVEDVYNQVEKMIG